MQTFSENTAPKLVGARKTKPTPYPSSKEFASVSTLLQILVVDDDPDFLELLCAQIQQIPGVSVDVANHPDEALKMLTKRRYQLVVSDWALDSSDASEVLTTADRIRGIEFFNSKTTLKKTPVMFISGSEKVFQTQVLKRLQHFEPVSFLLKSCGAPLIGLLASHILTRFTPPEAQPC